MRDFTTGIVYVNAGTIGAETHLPFGGMSRPATATARPAMPRSTRSPSGSRSTSTTRAGCSARRSTTNESPAAPPDRYFLSTAQRHALWENEIAMFIVLAMPLVIAALWYGATIEVIDFLGTDRCARGVQPWHRACCTDHVSSLWVE